VSIGVVLFLDPEASQDDLLKWADTAMYQSKLAGRNAVRFYLPDLRPTASAGEGQSP
jgi:GGDEF domain-containing protein